MTKRKKIFRLIGIVALAGICVFAIPTASKLIYYFQESENIAKETEELAKEINKLGEMK